MPSPKSVCPSHLVKELLESASDRTDRDRILEQLIHNTGLSRATLLRKARAAGYGKKPQP